MPGSWLDDAKPAAAQPAWLFDAKPAGGGVHLVRTPVVVPPGKTESALRGAAQGATLGWGDEAAAATEAGLQKVLPESMGGITYGKSLAQLYRENRDSLRHENEAAKKANPWTYGIGQVAGAAPLAIATGGKSTAALIGGGAALGGLSALGESSDPTVKGQVLDAAFGAGLGAAIPGGIMGIGRLAPMLRNALSSGAVSAGRRALRAVGGSLGASQPLEASAVREALRSGAIKLGGTVEGAASRLDALRQALGGQKGQIVNALERAGMTGPNIDPLAEKFAAEAAAAAKGSANPAVPRVFEQAAEQIASKGAPGSSLGIGQAEGLKSSLQDMARASYKQLDPSEVNLAKESAARMMRQASLQAVADQGAASADPATRAIAAQFAPTQERLANIIAAHEVAKVGAARAAGRSAISPLDLMAGFGGAMHGGSLTHGLATGLAEHLARTRGPSTAAVLAHGGAGALDYLMGPALTPTQMRLQAMARALRGTLLPAAAAEAGGEVPGRLPP